MGGFSLIHWIILGVVILLLFGGNRFSAMMGDVAKGLKSFKSGMDEDEPKRPADPQRASDRQSGEPRQIPPQTTYEQAPIDITPQPPRAADPAAPPPPPRDDNAG